MDNERSCLRDQVLAAWLLLNVMLPLAPIALAWAIQVLRGSQLSFRSSIKDGQLCFYPIAILGVAIFDSYTPLRSAIRVGNEAAQLALLVAMLIVIFLSTLAYAVILADHLSEHHEISDIKTRNISIFLTAISILLTYLAHSC